MGFQFEDEFISKGFNKKTTVIPSFDRFYEQINQNQISKKIRKLSFENTKLDSQNSAQLNFETSEKNDYLKKVELSSTASSEDS